MLEQSLDQQILTLTLSRPEAVNALNEGLYDALHIALQDARGNDQVRSVVIAASGTKAFCAGADLKEYAGQTPEVAEQKQMRFLLRCLLDLVTFPKPVAAAVHAPAVGAGMMLACACDEIVMAESAWMSLPEVLINIPSPIAAAVVGRRVRWGALQALLQRGERFDASACMQQGLADASCDSATVVRVTQERLAVYAKVEPHVYAINKRWMNRDLPTLLKAAADAVHMSLK